MQKVIFVMGVSGSGKTSIGRLLASELSVLFIDADDHHPESNIKKMSQGIPLNDKDREPWLIQLNQLAQDHVGSGCVIACSALKEAYRRKLTDSIESNAVWIYLEGTYEAIFERMQSRQGHFMGAEMLKSQFETLQEPDNAIRIGIVDTPELMVKKIKLHLK